MITLQTIPLFGSGIAGKSFVVTRQRRLNCYVEQRQDGDKTKVAIYGTPGLVPAFKVGTFPSRGMLGTQNNLFVVNAYNFQHLNSSGSVVATGPLNSVAGSVAMSTNISQVVIADGVNGYLYLPASGAFSVIPLAFPPRAKTVTFAAGFFVAEQPGTQQFWVSNFNDGSTWGSLAFASASAYPDAILAVDNLGGNLVTFSELHMEFFQNSGLTPQPFAPIQSAANEYGIAAIFSRAHVEDSIIFLAQSKQGQVQFVRVSGFNAQPVSTPDLDYIINGFSTVSDAVAYSYGADKARFYQVTFPSAMRSFLFDMSSGLWSEVQTGASIIPARHIGNYAAYFGGQTMVSDYRNNQIYTLSPTAYTDAGAVIAREIITRHVTNSFNRFRPSNLYLDMETGVGLQNGQGSKPVVMLQYSKDNGRTWSAERWASLGQVGTYLSRVSWRRFGLTRDATFRIRMTDPVKFVIAEGAMKVRQKRAA